MQQLNGEMRPYLKSNGGEFSAVLYSFFDIWAWTTINRLY
jgi:hypothetical protein